MVEKGPGPPLNCQFRKSLLGEDRRIPVNKKALKLLETAQFVVDAQGNKKAVLLDYKLWEQLLSFLEDWLDAEEIRRLRESGEETVPWEAAKEELRREGIDV
jgi:hypothetical protein